MRLQLAALPVVLALGLLGCSPNTAKCTPSSCPTGCCDTSGSCQTGSSTLACGAAGGTCSTCTLGEACTLGQCSSLTGNGGGPATGGGTAQGGGTGQGGGTATGGGSNAGGGSSSGGGSSTGGGSATGGGGGGLNPCAGTLTFCTSRCLDLAADPENCGRCGNVCGQGQVCNHGTCGVLPSDCTTQSNGCGAGYFCDPVSKHCMAGCRLTTDCPMGASCTMGTCACPTNQHACGQQCVADDAASSCGARCSACTEPAHSTATCVASACDFTCATGYTLMSGLCVDVNECATGNGGCSTNATCTNTDGARTCACNSGFTGDGVSCTDVNECAMNNGGCDANATCTNTPGARTCTCATGYSGNGVTCSDVDECATSNGGCAAVGGVCTNTPGSRTCACATGFTGNGLTCTDVNECLTSNGGCAAVGGVCTNTPGSRTCVCATGYTGNGVTCTDVDECLTSNGGCAAVGGVCTNTPGSRTCACATGFTGNGLTCTDLNECLTSNGGCATVGGVCTNTPGSRTCACATGYTGNGFTCTDVDECATGNGGCASPGGVCTNTPGSRTCVCATGFTGNGLTCTDINECLTNNGGCATVGGVCTNTPGSRTCACATGFTGNGVTCSDINECLTSNGGCDVNASCTNTPGSRTCTCSSGWTGNGLTCTDVNECLVSNGGCSVNATCTNTPGSRTCACNPGYLGNGVTCSASGDTCSMPNVLSLGVTFSGSTVGATNDYTTALSALCDSAALPGPDVVHVFTPASTGAYHVAVTGFSGTRVWLSTTCGATATCAASAPEFANPGFNFNGTAGTPVYLIVDSTSASGAYTLTLTSISALPNETCATAAPLTLGVPLSGSFIGAVNDVAPLVACGTPTYTQPELVYSFTPSTTGTYAFRETTSSDIVMWVGTGCSGACSNFVDDPEDLLLSLTAGTPYFFFVEPYQSATTFTLTLDQIVAPANDTCAGAIAIPLSTTVNGSTLGALNDYVGPLSAACSNSAAAGNDVAYSFTPAATGTYVAALTVTSGQTDAWLTTTCGTASACTVLESVGASNLVFRATAGVPLFLMVDSVTAGSADFGLSIDPVTPPANDTCATAQPLLLNTPASGTTIGAYDDLNPLPACGTSRRAGEVVFSFTPPTTGTYVFSETTTADVVMWVSTTCDGACTQLIDEPEQLVVTGTAGVPMLLFVESYAARGPFTVQVLSGAAPSNDTCSGAQALVLGATTSGTTSFAADDYTGALNGVCGGLNVTGRDTVYSFTPASSGNFELTTTASGWNPTVWISSACGSTASCVSSQSSTLAQVVRGTAAVPFFVAVDSASFSTSSGDYTLTLNSVPAPPNDTCATATPLTANVPVNSTTVGAVNDVHPLPACASSSRRNGEVMFSFVPPTSGTWFFHETGPADVLMWVGTACDGSCLAYIDDPEDLSLTLTAGTTYFLFVEPYATSAPITVVASTN